MYQFSNNSLKQLNTCCLQLQHIAHRAIKIVDFSVIEGLRTYQRQIELYNQGLTKSLKSFHLGSKENLKSRAFDILPYPFKYPKDEHDQDHDFNNRERFALMAGIFIGIAESDGIPLVWGGDWNRTFDPTKTKFYDAMHFQIDYRFYKRQV